MCIRDRLYACLERWIVENRLGDHGERQVAAVDGKPHALGKVHAGLAAAQLTVIGDVVVDAVSYTHLARIVRIMIEEDFLDMFTHQLNIISVVII